MRIGVLSDPANFHTQKWTQALQAAGAEVVVFSFSEAQIANIPCVTIKPRFTHKGAITYASYLFSGQRLREALIAHRIDLLNPINITPFGVWARRSGFRPIAAVAMGADILEFPPRRQDLDIPLARTWASQTAQRSGWLFRFSQSLKWYLFRREVKAALHAAGFITGDNLLLVEKIRSWFGVAPEKVRLNRWGIEPELFAISPRQTEVLRAKYQIRPGQPVVFSPRGLKPIYQGDIVLEAFARLLQKGDSETKYILLSAGYEIPEAVHQQALSLHQQYPNFHYEAGLIPREELCQLWNLVDVFVSAPVYDGYSNALSEGRFIGAVPVVNDIPATRELLVHQHNAWVVHPFDGPRLAEALKEILKALPDWKARFAPVNNSWICEHADLEQNMATFLQDCTHLVERHSSWRESESSGKA